MLKSPFSPVTILAWHPSQVQPPTPPNFILIDPLKDYVMPLTLGKEGDLSG